MVGTPSNVTNANGTVTWNIGDITEEPQSIQFKVKPKDGKYGKLYTNESVELSYTDCDGWNQQIKDTKTTEKPQIGNPYIKIANPARAYTVEYYYDDVKGDAPAGAPTGSTANVGDTVTISAGDSAGAMQFPKQTTVGTENYAFDEDAANVLNTTIVEDATKNVLKVHYATDKNGDGTPDYSENKYTITYAAGTTDTVTGLPAEVNGVLAGTKQTVSSEKPTREGYTFSGWQAPEGVTVTGNKFTMPANNVTFTAQWTPNDVTITFDANGGAWAADVANYTMDADNKTASKTYKPSDKVEKIATDPTNGTKKFVGWGITADATEPLSLWVLGPKAAKLKELTKGTGILYAIWEDAAQPTEKLNYTTRQHYIDEKGNEVGTVDVGGVDLLALQGTKISKLIQHLEKDQNYFGQKYLYDRTKTTVNDAEYKAETMTLNTNGTAIDLYYYLDAWNDKDDKVTGGDGTPDKYQALVKFESADATKGAVTGKGAVQVFTFKDTDGKYLTSGNVTPSLANVTTTPADGFAFDIWTKDKDVDSVNPEATMESVPGGTTIIFKANWKSNVVTITFDANGGAWAAAVDGYEMKDNNTKASKTYKPSEAVAKIPTDPVQAGKTFNGWYVKIPGKTGEEPEKYFITVWNAALQAQRIHQYGGVIYADWTGAAPAGQCTYTTRQHYINEKGVEELAVNIMVQSAEKGTKISDLIKHLEKDQTYYGQNYFYDRTKTTVNGDAYNAETMTLNTNGTAIDLYYYLDAWNDKDDKVTGGDGTPDKYQALVKFESADATKGAVTGKGAVQVFTFKDTDGKYLTSGNVTPSLANVTTTPADGFAFDIWTKDKDVDSVNPEATMESVPGGTTITFKAHFAADKIGPENKPDVIPDKYQAVVTYKVVGGTWKDKTTDDQVQVFTLKTKNKETGVWEDVTPAPVLGDTIPTGMISSYSRTASQSWDKDITKDTKVTESVTYTYTFTKGSSGGGGGSSSTHYYISLKKVDAQDGEALSGAKFGLYLDGKQIATATSDRNGIVRFSMGSSNYRSLTDKSNLYCQELTAPEGYKLSNEKIAVSKKDVSTSSSMSDKNAKTVKNSRSKTPSMLNGKDHFAYIVGYPDKTVHPQSSITRAEVATIFFRLLTEETRTANATKTNNYADVSSDKWYNQAVSTLSAMGIIKGDSRGNFNPNAPITRAEFAAIAARFDKTEDVAAASFGDVATHWAKPEISVAANNGWINGYTDGTFHPDSRITRAEAMAMINRVLQRLPESKADLLDGMIQWSDNADTSKWYYLAVQEATNSHYYELKANQHEKWTKLRENRDWTELEK